MRKGENKRGDAGVGRKKARSRKTRRGKKRFHVHALCWHDWVPLVQESPNPSRKQHVSSQEDTPNWVKRNKREVKKAADRKAKHSSHVKAIEHRLGRAATIKREAAKSAVPKEDITAQVYH
jgi:hypothetical protein